MTIKIFKMNDCDWVAAETINEAILCIAESSGMPEAEIEALKASEEYPQEVSDVELDRLQFAEGPIKRSFREELRARLVDGEEFPQFFASTEQ